MFPVHSASREEESSKFKSRRKQDPAALPFGDSSKQEVRELKVQELKEADKTTLSDRSTV